MDVTTLRSTLGLPADTPEAEVLRVANERLGSGESPPATEEGDDAQEPQEEGGDQPSTEDDPEDDAPEAEGEPAPLQQAARADGTVLVDAATLATFQQQASDGAAARARQIGDEDSAYLMAAVETGKFPPSRLEHWRTLDASRSRGNTSDDRGSGGQRHPDRHAFSRYACGRRAGQRWRLPGTLAPRRRCEEEGARRFKRAPASRDGGLTWPTTVFRIYRPGRRHHRQGISRSDGKAAMRDLRQPDVRSWAFRHVGGKRLPGRPSCCWWPRVRRRRLRRGKRWHGPGQA